MNTKEKIIKLWEYVKEGLGDELWAAVEEFEINDGLIEPDSLEALSEANAFELLSDIAEMFLHVFCDGDFEYWGDILHYQLGFDKETIENLVC